MSAANKGFAQKTSSASGLALHGGRICTIFLVEHDLLGKPASTFSDHALGVQLVTMAAAAVPDARATRVECRE
jgi:hypothetical protein